MNILVCLKMVSQSTYSDTFDDASGAERLSGGQLGINPADAYALELALRLKDIDSSVHITAITMAPKTAEMILRTALAMGVDEAVHISDRIFAGADTIATSATLAGAIRSLPPQDLILCGKKAVDSETGHIGPQLGALLGIPVITNVLEFSASESGITALRSQENGTVQYGCGFPALLTVVNGTSMVRSATIMGMRRSKNVLVQLLTGAELGMDAAHAGQNASGTETIEVRQLRFAHRGGQRETSAEAGAAAIADMLRRAGNE